MLFRSDVALLLLRVELAELALLLVIIDGSDEDDDGDGDGDGDSLDPVDLRCGAEVGRRAASGFELLRGRADVLVKAESEGDDGGDGEDELRGLNELAKLELRRQEENGNLRGPCPGTPSNRA